MTTPAKMTVHVSRPEKGRVPSSLVILLHGLGADGRDLLGLSGPWRDFLPDTVFVAPDAPFACDMAPYGHQWFSLRDWSPRAIRAGVEKTAPILDAFISAQCAEYNIPPARTALVGFSQGTMMALYVAPRHKEKLAGVLGYSGGLVGGEDLAANKQFHRLPICLIHGEADDVVPVAAYTLARRTLGAAGFPVSGHTTPGLPHSIDDAGIETGGEFLKENLER
ncbi:MAG TPA: dienelactone hydrolase family protein [Alphaproteobacteria bacterium]|nr:dienelactone hydrolase family protein [Alphaproteobacteria bacterium]